MNRRLTQQQREDLIHYINSTNPAEWWMTHVIKLLQDFDELSSLRETELRKSATDYAALKSDYDGISSSYCQLLSIYNKLSNGYNALHDRLDELEIKLKEHKEPYKRSSGKRGDNTLDENGHHIGSRVWTSKPLADRFILSVMFGLNAMVSWWNFKGAHNE